MSIFVRIICVTLVINYFSSVLAAGTTTAVPSAISEPSLVFQIIQSQLVIDNSMVESATIIVPKNSIDSYGLQIKLKNTAANVLAGISGENIGKQLNIVLGDKVISSPRIQSKLGAEFQIFGFTKEQVDRLVNTLVLSK